MMSEAPQSKQVQRQVGALDWFELQLYRLLCGVFTLSWLAVPSANADMNVARVVAFGLEWGAKGLIAALLGFSLARLVIWLKNK